jgi:hypothetical protein
MNSIQLCFLPTKLNPKTLAWIAVLIKGFKKEQFQESLSGTAETMISLWILFNYASFQRSRGRETIM